MKTDENGDAEMDDAGSVVMEPETEDEIVTGKGYWVWSAEPGTLVP